MKRNINKHAWVKYSCSLDYNFIHVKLWPKFIGAAREGQLIALPRNLRLTARQIEKRNQTTFCRCVFWALSISQNASEVRALPRTRLGELTALPQTPLPALGFRPQISAPRNAPIQIPDYKKKCRPSCLWKSVAQLRNVTCPMGSYNVKCHPTQVNTPRFNPSRTGRYSIYLSRRDGRLSWPRWLVTYLVYPPADCHPSKY